MERIKCIQKLIRWDVFAHSSKWHLTISVHNIKHCSYTQDLSIQGWNLHHPICHHVSLMVLVSVSIDDLAHIQLPTVQYEPPLSDVKSHSHGLHNPKSLPPLPLSPKRHTSMFTDVSAHIPADILLQFRRCFFGSGLPLKYLLLGSLAGDLDLGLVRDGPCPSSCSKFGCRFRRRPPLFAPALRFPSPIRS